MRRLICLLVLVGMTPMVAALGTTFHDDAVVAGAEGQFGGLDKSWTSGGQEKSGGLQVVDESALAKHRSFEAERGDSLSPFFTSLA